MTVASNTIVKNGMPFIGLVLSQVEPFMTHMVVTLSKKSDDETKETVQHFAYEHPNKVEIFWEDVILPGKLTGERQRQLQACNEDWILFLDDDDYWPENSLREVLSLIGENKDILGYGVNPFQLLPDGKHDYSWRKKYFTKFFRNGPDTNYRHPWPRDLIYNGDDLLYWKANPKVKRINQKFFHLSAIKKHSFRKDDWAKTFAFTEANPVDLPEQWKEEAWKILKYQ